MTKITDLYYDHDPSPDGDGWEHVGSFLVHYPEKLKIIHVWEEHDES